MQDVMLDLETLGTAPGSIILAIGAVTFDAGASPDPQRMERFYLRVDVDSCVRAGLTFEPGTLAWWLGQPDEARDEAFLRTPRKHINEALLACAGFFRQTVAYADTARIWSHGAGYDVVLFEEALRRTRLGQPPWKFGNIRDTRTLYDLAGVRRDRTAPEIPHHALHDAIAQAVDVQRAHAILHSAGVR